MTHRRDPDGIEFRIVDPEDLDARAWLAGLEVGRANAVRAVQANHRLLLADLTVEEPYRRRGVGGRLLAFLILAAEAAGISEIWGRVTEKDQRETPGLLDWYRRRGFRVVEPGEFPSEFPGPVAAHFIVRTIGRREPEGRPDDE